MCFSLQKQETYLKTSQKKATKEKIRASTSNTVTETNKVDKNSQYLLVVYHLNYKPISTFQSQYLRV